MNIIMCADNNFHDEYNSIFHSFLSLNLVLIRGANFDDHWGTWTEC